MTGLDLLAKTGSRGLFIAGEWRDASSGARFDVHDPADESVITDVADGNTRDASAALDAVHVAIAVAAVAVARPRLLALASLALWLLGVLAAGSWLSLDTADNWQPVVLAVVVLGLAPLVGGEDLADDLERDLGGRLAAQVDPDRPAHAVEQRSEVLAPLLLRAP